MKKKGFICIFTAVYALLTVICFLKPPTEYSLSERRKLAKMPEFSWEELVDGTYIRDVESCVVDQFPFRDRFRTLKNTFSLNIMGKKDVNNIYVKDGHLWEMEYPMDGKSIDRAAGIFEEIYEKNIKGTNAKPYLAVVPDKNYFWTDCESILTMDYEVFFNRVYEKTSFLQPIMIAESLELSDYYRTDSHWKQESITEIAAHIAKEMDVPYDNHFTVTEVEEPFFGVYYGRAGVKEEPDTIRYCTGEMLDACKVYDHENGCEIALYDRKKALGRDPYEMFLGGNISLVTVENKSALSEKELVVFGDSYCRSLVPLLAGSYKKITVMDIRYLPSSRVEEYITFSNQDVLFLYSTSVLNNSIVLK